MSPPKAEFYVAPNGRDDWSGKLSAPDQKRTNGPFASISRAQRAVRQVKADESNRAKPVLVRIRGGMYYLDAPLRFEPEDSGTSEAPVIYLAFPGEEPVISGGVQINGWRETDTGWWQTCLPEVEKGQWNFTQLFVNDKRRYRTRLPREGYSFIAEEVPPTEESEGKGFDRFKFHKGDVRGDWHNLNDVEVLCFHIWEMSRMRLESVNARECIAALTGPTCRAEYYAALFKGNRFLVENVREALKYPGQWYLDRTNGMLTYIPMPDEALETTRVIAPRLEQLLSLEGDVGNRDWVRHIHFEGITFAHSNWTTPAGGHSCPQAEHALGTAVYAEGARDCSFVGCTIKHIGTYALQWATGCRRNLIEGCVMTDLGGGGVRLGSSCEPEDSSDEEDEAAYQTIRDCLISHAGRLHPGAVGIWIGHSPYNRIEHNEIADLYYTGISTGWVWGYQESKAHHNIFAFNHIHHLGQHVLSDMGGIYLLGVSPGTVIRCNRIHDVDAFDYGGWGIYFDQGASDVMAMDNICTCCNGQNFHQHYGRDNIVVNNIFAFGGRSQIERTRQEDHCSFIFERNIVLWKSKAPLFGENMTSAEPIEKGLRMDTNLYYNAGGCPIRFGTETLDQWRHRGCDRHSIIADPLFIDPDNGDFGLKPGTPAERIGFQPIHANRMGRLTHQDRDSSGSSAVPAFPTGFTVDDVREVMEKEFDAGGIVT